MQTLNKLPKNKVVRYFTCDIAKGLFNGMIGNYLLYFYQPTAKSGLPFLLPDNKLLGYITIIALITGLSKVIDAITDPLVASFSDKCTHPKGRRMPFMRVAAIPYALCVLMVFFAPFPSESIGNAIWVGFFLIAYYIFYTMFFIPQRALIPEVIPDSNERVGYYAISTVFFMGSSAFMYTATLFVSWLKSAGISPLWSWRIVFLIFAIIGVICLLVSAFAFDEKTYIKNTKPPQDSLLKSFKVVFSNKQFVIFTLGDLCNYIAMAFFQSTMIYYITVLINIPEAQSFIVMIAAIATAICFFPFIVKISRKANKKTPLLVGSWIFAAVFCAIFFGDSIAKLFVGKELVLGIIMGICVAYPFASINILPQAVVSDIIQADCLLNGTNREGIFSAVKTFMEKIASAIALIIVSSLLAVGAKEGEKVGLMGVKLTGIFAGFFSILSAVFFMFYNDKQITTIIKQSQSVELEESNDN